MTIKTTGIILKKRNIGEKPDRIVTVLTKDFGITEAVVRGMKSVRNNPLMAVSVLGYYEFIIFKGKSTNYINAAEMLESFYCIRTDVEKLALAGYLCELICSIEPSRKDSSENLRLLLNTLYFINNSKRNPSLLKSIYELRAVSMAGFMPDMVGCRYCGQYEKDLLFFFPSEGVLECGECNKLREETVGKPKYVLSPPLLMAIRHILYSDLEKLFRFNISEDVLKNLNILTEYYTLLHTEKNFNSLDMYKQLKTGGI